MPHHLPFGWGQWDCHRIYKHTEAKPNPPESYLLPSGSTSHIPFVICAGFSGPKKLRITSGHKNGEDLPSQNSSHLYYMEPLSWHKRAPAQGTELLLQALVSSSYPVAELQHTGTSSASDAHTWKQPVPVRGETTFSPWKLQNCH